MLLAMCLGGEMVIVMLLGLLVVGVACCVPFVFAVILILKWVNARRERLATETTPASSF